MVKKTYATGKLIDIVTLASNRIEPTCNLYGVCGGCQLQHITYEGQLSLKTQKVKDVIERIGHQNPDLVKPALDVYKRQPQVDSSVFSIAYL